MLRKITDPSSDQVGRGIGILFDLVEPGGEFNPVATSILARNVTLSSPATNDDAVRHFSGRTAQRARTLFDRSSGG